MGALAGNPMLGTPPPYYYGGPPTDPNAPFWPAPPAAAAAGHRDNRLRNGLIAGGAALVVLAAGIGIGHATWNNGTQIPSAASSNNNQFPRSNGSNPFNGNGSNPFQTPGNSGSTGSGNSGSSSSGASGPSDANAIADKVDPGLVDINTSLGYQQEQAAGTGIVVTSDGEILTNNHVIDGATSISVTDVGNKKTYTASVVGYDRTGDIAVLQLHNASGLQTANFANSSGISVGEDVVGVGNAGGTGGTPSAAGGTVTALNQSITAQDQGDGTSEQLSGLIETNANIQAGDSGGALVNTSGQVIGVDTAASGGTSFQFNGQDQGNQGFAIPINTALSIARQIEAGNGSSTIHIGTTAFLGVEISPNGSNSSSGSGSGGGGNGSGPFGGFFGGNSGSTGNTGSSGSIRIGRSSCGRRDQRSGAGGRYRTGRRHHDPRWQVHQLGRRPHQGHGRLPPGRQGTSRMDRRQRPDTHGDRPTQLGSAAVTTLQAKRPGSRIPSAGRAVCRVYPDLPLAEEPRHRDDHGEHRGTEHADEAPTDTDVRLDGHRNRLDLLHRPEHVVDRKDEHRESHERREEHEEALFGGQGQTTEHEYDDPTYERDVPVDPDQVGDALIDAVQ